MESATAVLLQLITRDIAGRMGFTSLDSDEVTASKLAEVQCTDGYEAGGCGGAFGCTASWECDNGSSGCYITHPILC